MARSFGRRHSVARRSASVPGWGGARSPNKADTARSRRAPLSSLRLASSGSSGSVKHWPPTAEHHCSAVLDISVADAVHYCSLTFITVAYSSWLTIKSPR
ncbi:unnamed protein product [Macrosiphum euphorbiae]|uniref:Uncharacterized protein n=1 Tax=Macrosiphum euphorbiae TaxID=13131 RepID=A0AAV0XJM0_9HEMI|nr:unnamed protein product [Macrosiphum euphorbiae]